jgi:hypothetical protein
MNSEIETLFIRTVIFLMKNADSVNWTLKSALSDTNYTYCISQQSVLHIFKCKKELSFNENVCRHCYEMLLIQDLQRIVQWRTI